MSTVTQRQNQPLAALILCFVVALLPATVRAAEHPISVSFQGAASVQAADLDGDGDADVVGAAATRDEVAWWENVAGDASQLTRRVIGEGIDGAIAVFAADVDGDGDVDVAVAAEDAGEVSWWENDLGDGSSWTEHLIEGDFDGAFRICPGDMNGDGHADIVAASGGTELISWWEGPITTDLDGDGYSGADDCDESDAAINIAATEVCDGADNDCDGLVDGADPDIVDADGDGSDACDDCDDADAGNYPDNAESCDGVDNDCDGFVDQGLTNLDYWPDSDGDGYGDAASMPISDCAPVAGHVSNSDDGDATINPAAAEACDAVDNNCDGAVDEGFDTDGDGYTSCGGDCDDGDSSINPTAAETCDGVDNDCDGDVDEEIDGDGDGYTPCAGDCDDSDAAVNPAAAEACDAVDNDCDVDVVDTTVSDNESDTYGGGMYLSGTSAYTSTNSGWCDNLPEDLYIYQQGAFTLGGC